MIQKQSVQGKAFEYACLYALYSILRNNQNINVDQDKPFNTAKSDYDKLPYNDQLRYIKAANAGIRRIIKMEPRLQNNNGFSDLSLSILKDSSARTGDVRDIVCIRYKGSKAWQIGISCKHNHAAVKHSRLSNTIDFGEEWMNHPCSKKYWNAIKPIFDDLKIKRSLGILWEQIPNKQTSVYIPILNAFQEEMSTICKKYLDAPGKFANYMLGNNDFYKLISKEAENDTYIEAFNINKTLNKPAGKVRAQQRAPQLKLPTDLLKIDFKKLKNGENSSTTIIVCFDQGWTFSMRLHNAKKLVEPSVKFDIQLISNPSDGHYIEPW